MRICCVFIMVLSFVQSSIAQETAHLQILKTPNWGAEYFDFPIKFASAIPYKGYEEAVFPKGWSNKDSIEFWSYAFAWKIEANIKVTTQVLELQLETYFDGLMDIKNRANGSTIFPTKASLNNTVSNTNQEYKGAVYFYEGRYTKQMMTLYTKARLFYCNEENKLILLFKFSPKNYNALIWEQLNTITLLDKSCN